MKKAKILGLRRLGIFDIDGTIFRSSLVVEMIRALVARGVYPKSALKEMEKDYLAWVNREGTFEKFIEQVIAVNLKNIRGCKKSDYVKVAKEMVARDKGKVYRYTRGLIKELKKENYVLVAISGSPTEAVEEFARHFGFDGAFGNVYEVKNGRYTGGVIGGDSFYNKRNILFSFLENHPDEFDLSRSIAVGDTQGDIPMLEMVGRPIAFNPNGPLAIHARSQKWPIVIERKDMIYKLHFPRGWMLVGAERENGF